MPAPSRCLAAAVVVAAAFTGIACGDDGGGDPSDAVRSLVEQSFPSSDVSADCPDTSGERFECDVTVGSETVKVPVQDADGEIELREAVVNLGDVERTIETRSDEQDGVAVSAECGASPDDTVLVAKPGATFTCTLENSGGGTSETTVTVENLQGDVSFQL